MTTINKDRLQIFGEGLFAKIKARFVDKTADNIIAGKTVILNGYIPGVVLTKHNNQNSMHTASGIGHFCGMPSKIIPANRYISHIVFAINDSFNVGDVVEGVNIGVVKASNNEVVEMLKVNAKYTANKNEHSDLTGDKVVVVDIDKQYNEDVYIIYGARGMLWNNTINHGNISCVGGNTLPRVGDILHASTGNFIGRFKVYEEGTALQDLANSSNDGVSGETFQQHVRENERGHQTLNSSILKNTELINVANQNIENLENSTVKKGSPNIFLSQNTFKNNSPVVEKYFSIKNIAADGIEQLYTGATYCCNPREGVSANSFISAIVVPIHNSQPGDTIQASYFTFNSHTLRTTSGVLGENTYTVQDILYKGHYCIVLDVNNSFSYDVGFGFGVTEKFAGARRIGLLKQELPNLSDNNAWTSYHRPSNNDSLSNSSGKFMIPYMITRKARSEVVTRFDLDNNTVPSETYKFGELKMFAFDIGESTEIGNKTWIRCEGQTVNADVKNANAQSSITLPVSEEGKYIYVCVG